MVVSPVILVPGRLDFVDALEMQKISLVFRIPADTKLPILVIIFDAESKKTIIFGFGRRKLFDIVLKNRNVFQIFTLYYLQPML